MSLDFGCYFYYKVTPYVKLYKKSNRVVTYIRRIPCCAENNLNFGPVNSSLTHRENSVTESLDGKKELHVSSFEILNRESNFTLESENPALGNNGYIQAWPCLSIVITITLQTLILKTTSMYTKNFHHFPYI